MARYNRIKVVDVMTKNPLVMTPAETIGQADELMTENRIRQLPVVTSQSKINSQRTGQFGGEESQEHKCNTGRIKS